MYPSLSLSTRASSQSRSCFLLVFLWVSLAPLMCPSKCFCGKFAMSSRGAGQSHRHSGTVQKCFQVFLDHSHQQEPSKFVERLSACIVFTNTILVKMITNAFVSIFSFSLLNSVSLFSSLSLISCLSPFSFSLLFHISPMSVNDNDSDHWFSQHCLCPECQSAWTLAFSLFGEKFARYIGQVFPVQKSCYLK